MPQRIPGQSILELDRSRNPSYLDVTDVQLDFEPQKSAHPQKNLPHPFFVAQVATPNTAKLEDPTALAQCWKGTGSGMG